MKLLFTYISIFISFLSFAQETQVLEVFSFEEFMGFVKQHHPVVKQANLKLKASEAYLVKARGGFDPKLAGDFFTKEYKEKTYYDIFNASLKVPTWYGVEFKANYENNSGYYLNPERTVPEDGLYSAGIKVNILEGLLINDRMADLKKAKFYIKETEEKRKLIVNDILFQAAMAYFDWIKAYNELNTYNNFLINADNRFNAVKKNVEVGSRAAIDSTEAKITVQNRLLNIEAAKLNILKKQLKVSNFLWVDGVPLELKENSTPKLPTKIELNSAEALSNEILDNFNIDEHPKVKALSYKSNGLTIDKRLYLNKLLPKLSVDYNFLTPEVDTDYLETYNYKAKIGFSTPLFLRKERANLRLSKYKIQDTNLEILSQQLQINNKIEASKAEILSMEKQLDIVNEMVNNYQLLLNGAERKYEIGESSLLAINLYESKLIESKLKQISTQNKFLKAVAKTYNTIALMEEL